MEKELSKVSTNNWKKLKEKVLIRNKTYLLKSNNKSTVGIRHTCETLSVITSTKNKPRSKRKQALWWELSTGLTEAHRDVLLLIFQLFDPDSFVSGAAYVLPLWNIATVGFFWHLDIPTAHQQSHRTQSGNVQVGFLHLSKALFVLRQGDG